MTFADEFIALQETTPIETYRLIKERVRYSEALLDSGYCIDWDDWDQISSHWWCFKLLEISFERKCF